MGEIDTKSIESVQAALSLFGEKNDQRKYRSTGVEGKQESEKEKQFDLMLKDLANYKVQLEVKESAFKQALLRLELYQKIVDKLSTQLKNSEAERDQYIEECIEARTRVDELETKTNEILDQLLESGKVQEQFLHAVNKLKATQEELLNTRAELATAEESKLAAMKQAELLETTSDMEKGKTEELLKHISELNEAIRLSKLDAIEAEKENSTILLEKDAEIQMATSEAVQAQEQLEEMRKQIDMMQDLENQLLSKTQFVDSVQVELEHMKELHTSSAQAASDAIDDLNQLKSELERMERANSDQAIYVESMETEMKQLQLELKNAKEELSHLSREVEMFSGEIQKVKSEMDEVRGRENEAQVEIAMLKSELHKGRSKIAAAEAAEARVWSIKSGLYLAVQQLAKEAQEAKKETQRLKQAAEKKTEAEEETGSLDPVDSQFADSTQDLEQPQVEDSKIEAEERSDDTDSQITIPMKEYTSLISKADKADQVVVAPPEDLSHLIASGRELEALKKELEAAMAENEELRFFVGQVVSKAELAEKTKAAIEDQLRKRRERKLRRRAALAALREESIPKESNPHKYDKPPTMYQPLGKVLNMKF